MDDIEVKDASELLDQFFSDIFEVLQPIRTFTDKVTREDVKNRLSDFITNYGDSLFLVDIEEVSGKRMFLRRRLFEVLAERKDFIRVFQDGLVKENIVAAVNENFEGEVEDFRKEADAQFIIGLRSLVIQIYDRFRKRKVNKEDE